MQAAPAVQVSVQRFGAWNRFLIVLGVAATVACSAWFMARSDDLPVWSGGLVVAALLIALCGAGLSVRRHPVTLRWDTQRWYLTEMNDGSAETGPAQVRVTIDAGAWLLLKFTPDGRSNPLSVRWVPVQRRAIEAQWHALRCAVYSPRAEGALPIGLDGGIRIE